VQFIGESAVFLMIGLQMRDIVTTTQNDTMSLPRVLLAAGVILLVVMLLRPIWVFPSRWVLSRTSRGSGLPPRELVLVSWAGMRGVVTLAAAFLVPVSAPERQAIIFIAMVVAIGTLALQGLTLPWLTRALKVQGPDAREDALQQAVLTEHAVSAGLAELDQHRDEPHGLLRQLREEARRRTNQGWERVGPRGLDNEETPSDAYRRLRVGMIAAERRELVRLRDEGAAEHDLLAEILQQLDIEESVLESFAADREDGERHSDVRPPQALEGGCSHLTEAPQHTKAIAPVCVGCRESGSTWVHLRKCLTCGYVGCCDSSPQVHARRHYEQTHHAVVESFEEGEAWRWCYVDSLTG
jgi:CPA1 family monovalent cation:H+ antiporter